MIYTFDNKNFNNLFLYFHAFAMGVPIAIFTTNSFQLPLSAIALPIALIALIIHPNSKEKILFLLSLLLSAIGSAIYCYAYNLSLSRSLLSIIWFFSPYLFFFLGSMSITDRQSFKLFIKSISIISSFSIYALFFSIMIYHNGTVRTSIANNSTLGVEYGSTITGTILGLKLYGAWGVNSLATYFLIVHCLFITFILNNLTKNNLIKAFVIGATIITLFFILSSISRGTILGLLVFYIGILIPKIGKKRYIIIAAFVALVTITINWGYISNIIDTKLSRHLELLANNQYGDFLSGRVDIYKTMFDQLASNIFIGRGFTGFGDAVELSTSSPHNQFLGALWKMGLIAFIPYFYFIYIILSKITSRKILKDQLLIPIGIMLLVITLILNLVWDNFTVPILGAIIMYLSGAITKITRTE